MTPGLLLHSLYSLAGGSQTAYYLPSIWRGYGHR
jgi:hypothetical protein